MRFALALAAAFLTGCATVDSADCRNAYDIGFRDALYGIQRQDDLYRPICSRLNAELDVAGYAHGWQEGLYEFQQRKIHGGVE